MKRILFILTFLSLVFISKGQNPIPTDSIYPVNQALANTPTAKVISNAIQVKDGFINAVFTDTTAANLYSNGYRIKYFPGAQIFTTSDSAFWLRNSFATRWMKNSSGAGSITSFNFITDSSIIICYGDGTCDTIPIYNFTEIIQNIVNNFIDSSIFNLNDSTLIICNAAGSCDTINLGTTNTFYFINDSTIVTCDTLETICVGDSCYTQQICDTIPVPKITRDFHQNDLYQVPSSTHVIERGRPLSGEGQGELVHDTWTYTNGNQYTIQGRPIGKPLLMVQQDQWVQESPSIIGFKAYGTYPDAGKADSSNPVGLYLNYTNPFDLDSTGFMHDRIGYMWMTNAKGSRYAYTVEDADAKQVGIFFDTYTDNTEGVTIFAQRVPSTYNFANNPPTDSTLLSKRVAVFKTNQQLQLPAYLQDAFTSLPPKYLLGVDSLGNVIETIGAGDVITIINDTTINICSFGVDLCDTITINNIGNIQFVTILNDSTIIVCGASACDTLVVHTTTFNQSITANNGLSMSTPSNVQLGQGVAAAGNPAILLSHREIPMGGFTISLNASATQAVNIFQTKNAAAAIRARITSIADFSNTGGQTGAEKFGDLAVVGGSNDVAIGNTANTGTGGGNIAIGHGAILSGNFTGRTLIGTAGTGSGNNNQTGIGSGVSMTARGTIVGVSGVLSGTNGTGYGEQVNIASGHEYSQAYGFGATTTAANQFVIGSTDPVAGGINDMYLGRGVTSTAANNFKMQPTGASGADMAGNTFTIAGSPGTGNATPGVIIFQTSTAGASSSTLQSLANKIQINGSGILAYNGVMPTSGSGGTDSAIFRNSSTGQYYLAPGSAVITADNGLTKNTATNVQLGGTGIQYTNIDWGAFTFTNTFNTIDSSGFKITSNSTVGESVNQRLLDVRLSGANANAGALTYAIYGSNTHTGSSPVNIGVYGEAIGGSSNSIGVSGYASAGVGVYGEGGAYGVYGSSGGTAAFQGTASSNALGIYVESTNGVTVNSVRQSTTTNSVITTTQIERSTFNTAADGIGLSVDFKLEADNGTMNISNQIISKSTVAAAATRTSQLTFTGVLSAATVDLLVLGGDGSVKLRPITATAASAITPAEGMLVFVSNTDATFTTVGIWCYQNGAWKAL